MDSNNVKTMAVTAIVIVICLLFSWVQYGDDSGDEPQQEESFEGTWYPVYTYNSGVSGEITAPEELIATVSDGVVFLTDGETTLQFPLTSSCEAVSVRDGAGYQLYLEDGILYLVRIFSEPDINGIIYIAMSKDSTATFPIDRVDLSGTIMEMSGSMTDGIGFRQGNPVTLTVDSHSFHVAKGTIVSEDGSYGFTGFVKSDGSRSVIIGCYTVSDGSSGVFNAVMEGEEGAFALEDTYTYAGQTPGMATSLADGTIDVVTSTETMVFEVDLEGCLANVINEVVHLPGSVMWTLGDDYLLFGFGSIASFDGSEYVFIINNLVA